ncbi:unnamed protein product [Brachionus calyciflorus]|uniref:Deacetylase sirtuin-type domain-containing protein n=1 Tax=Brachionus calyciflorus TaxID=104777 RepID=A0A813S616_9BILA|nr:unnamed protein product [Brachionus calyciflorus]
MEPIKIGSNETYTIDNLVLDISSRKIKKIVVMTGAGISTPSGIPDFRSPGSGLYNNLSQYEIPYPEAIFETSFFRQNPKPFFTLAKDLIPNIEKYRPNKIHYFLRLLQEKKLLLRLYTQNIDGLESLAGVDTKKLIEAHGSFRTAKCINCKSPYSGIFVKNEVFNDRIPTCKYGNCSGVVKPDIVFFGDKLPDNFYSHHENDFLTADCIIVMGTSLEVEPFANIILGSHFNAPRLLMNKESVGPFKKIKKLDRRKDLQMLGDLVDIVNEFVNKLGWANDLEKLITKETEYIEANKHSTLEKNFYKIVREKNMLRANSERQSKTSFEKRERERIDSAKRKTAMDIVPKKPPIKTFLRNTQPKDTSISTHSFNSRKSNIKKNESVKEKIRLFYQDVDTLTLTDSTSEEDEPKNEKNIEKPPVFTQSVQKSDFIQRNYEFQLKLAFNLNQLQALETKFSDLNLNNQIPKPIKRVNSLKSIAQDNNQIDNNESKSPSKNVFFKNSLATANSKPLLVKRVQSGVNRL